MIKFAYRGNGFIEYTLKPQMFGLSNQLPLVLGICGNSSSLDRGLLMDLWEMTGLLPKLAFVESQVVVSDLRLFISIVSLLKLSGACTTLENDP